MLPCRCLHSVGAHWHSPEEQPHFLCNPDGASLPLATPRERHAPKQRLANHMLEHVPAQKAPPWRCMPEAAECVQVVGAVGLVLLLATGELAPTNVLGFCVAASNAFGLIAGMALTHS